MCSEKLIFSIDFFALFIQIIASVIMFQNSPENKPQGIFMRNTVDIQTPKRRNNSLRFGFLLLCVGFVLQMGSLIIKNPF